MCPTMAPGPAEEAPSDGGALDPLEDMRHTHSSRWEDRRFGRPAPPSPPARATAGGGRELVCPWLFSEHWMLHACCSQYHRQTRNIDPNISRWMFHGRRFATWENLFATSQKLFVTFSAPRNPDRRLICSPHPNRAAQHPSDASAQIGRPGASSSVPSGIVVAWAAATEARVYIADEHLRLASTEYLRQGNY
jgi:hypothetical protein